MCLWSVWKREWIGWLNFIHDEREKISRNKGSSMGNMGNKRKTGFFLARAGVLMLYCLLDYRFSDK